MQGAESKDVHVIHVCSISEKLAEKYTESLPKYWSSDTTVNLELP